ncbi:hypothetical protein [Pectobacterium aquaticum]|uniref:hypothetical protein n=1 Tax=Pectobacterium aquaticum TaxID=2204145 RepID=UPI00142E7615|nr:hypothetical protein [Pectobacterium aquaticum]UEM38774.1 hypothetical protein DMB82_0016770 [Pectobacterium aquaticum]
MKITLLSHYHFLSCLYGSLEMRQILIREAQRVHCRTGSSLFIGIRHWRDAFRGVIPH